MRLAVSRALTKKKKKKKTKKKQKKKNKTKKQCRNFKLRETPVPNVGITLLKQKYKKVHKSHRSAYDANKNFGRQESHVATRAEHTERCMWR